MWHLPNLEALNAPKHIGKRVLSLRRVAAFICLFILPAGVAAETDALAVLEQHCVSCHGGESTKAKLDLTTREALLRGGESGPAVVPEELGGSLLVQMVRHEKDPGMPYKKEKLPEASIEAIAAWVKAGVPYARTL